MKNIKKLLTSLSLCCIFSSSLDLSAGWLKSFWQSSKNKKLPLLETNKQIDAMEELFLQQHQNKRLKKEIILELEKNEAPHSKPITEKTCNEFFNLGNQLLHNFKNKTDQFEKHITTIFSTKNSNPILMQNNSEKQIRTNISDQLTKQISNEQLPDQERKNAQEIKVFYDLLMNEVHGYGKLTELRQLWNENVPIPEKILQNPAMPNKQFSFKNFPIFFQRKVSQLILQWLDLQNISTYIKKEYYTILLKKLLVELLTVYNNWEHDLASFCQKHEIASTLWGTGKELRTKANQITLEKLQNWERENPSATKHLRYNQDQYNTSLLLESFLYSWIFANSYEELQNFLAESITATITTTEQQLKTFTATEANDLTMSIIDINDVPIQEKLDDQEEHVRIKEEIPQTEDYYF